MVRFFTWVRYLLIYSSRSAFSALALVLVLVGGGYGFAQTDAGKAFIKSKIQALFAQNFNGRIDFESLSISLPNKLLLNGFKVYVGKDRLPSVAAASIGVEVLPDVIYDGLLNGFLDRVHVRKIEIVEPTLRLIEDDAGDFTLLQLLKPDSTAKPDTSIERLPRIILDEVAILNGDVLWKRLVKSATTNASAQFSEQRVAKLNIRLKVEIAEKLVAGVLQEFNFELQPVDFTLQNVSGYFRITDQQIELLSFQAATSESDVSCTAQISGVNVFDSVSVDALKNALIAVHLRSEKLSLQEFKRFAPSIPLPSGNYSFTLDAKGTSESLTIKPSFIQTPASRLNIEGTVENLADIEKLRVDVSTKNSFLSTDELPKLFPKMDLPDVSRFGKVVLNGRFRGSMRKIRTEFSLSTRAGDGVADMDIGFGKNAPLVYNGRVTIRNLNLAAALGDSSRKTNINFTGTVEGRGTTITDADAHFTGRLEKSTILKREISSAQLDITVKDKRVTGDFKLYADTQAVAFNGVIDFSKPEPTYEGAGRLERFNLGKWIQDDSLQTSLSLNYTVNGKNFAPDKASGFFEITFDSSSIIALTISKGAVAALSIDQTPESSSINLTSDIVSFEANGKFDLAKLYQLISLEGSVLREELYKDNIFRDETTEEMRKRAAARADSLLAAISKSKRLKSTRANLDSIAVLPDLNATYVLRFKKLSQLALLVKSNYFNAVGAVKGELRTTARRCTFTAAVESDSASFGAVFAARTLKGALVYTDSISIDTVLRRPQHTLSATFNANVFRMKLAQQRFVKTNFKSKYTTGDLDLNFRTTNQNTKGLIDLDVDIRVIDDRYEANIRNASFATQNYLWQSDPFAKIQISKDLIKFENVHFTNDDQDIRIEGALEPSGNNYISLLVKNFSLAELRQFIFNNPNQRLDGRLNLSADFSGNLVAPSIAFEANLDQFSYDIVDFGHIGLRGGYANRQFTFSFEANLDTVRYAALNLPRQAYNHISGVGQLPIDLSINADKIFRDDADLSVRIKSSDLTPKLLEFFFPLRNASGDILADFSLTGRFPKPAMALELSLVQVKATAAASNVPYLLNGHIFITPDRVTWQEASVADNSIGRGTTSGVVRMNTFDVQDFDIAFQFDQLKLLDIPAAKKDETIGKLIASSKELRLYGNLDHMELNGAIELNTTQLIQFRSSTSATAKIAEANAFITTIVEEDTSLEARLKRNPRLNLTLDEEFELSESARLSRSVAKSSFMDDLDMNLKVSIQQPIGYAIVFDKYLGEKLETVIDELTMSLQKRGAQYIVFGNAGIAGGRYNAYGKSFELEQGGKMTWRGGGLSDADMDIFARYATRIQSPTRNDFDNVLVRLRIAGTIDDPNIEIGYIVNERQFRQPNTKLPGEDDPNALPNFITLVTANQWFSPPGSQGSSGLSANTLRSAGLSAGAGLLSSQVTRLASGITGVQSVNIGFAQDRSGNVAGLDASVGYAVPGTDGRLIVTGSVSTATADSLGLRNNTLSNSQKLEYRVTRNVILEAFRNFGPNNFNLFNNAIAEVWGVGVSYRENFHSWTELGERWNRYISDFVAWISGSRHAENIPTPTTPPDSAKTQAPKDSTLKSAAPPDSTRVGKTTSR
jgi:hypothetical protein